MADNPIAITQNLSELFSDAIGGCRVILFSAPAGCGKTSSAIELLRRGGIEYKSLDAGAPDFARRLAGVLPDERSAPIPPGTASPVVSDGKTVSSSDGGVLLVDNLQSIDKAGEDALSEQIRTHPLSRFILCGRCPLPGWLVQYEAERTELTIEPEDLMLDSMALEEVSRGRGLELSRDELGEIIQLTEGYPLMAMLVLDELGRRAARGMRAARFSEDVYESVRTRIFNYLQKVIYADFSLEERSLMLSVSPFEYFDASLAEVLTSNPRVESIIGRFQRDTRMFSQNAFGRLTFWPLWQSFLIWQMEQEWSRPERQALYARAAMYFEQSGDHVLAIRCHDLCGERHKVIELLERHSRLNPRRGYFRELAPYYLALPEDDIASSPDLMMGMSMLMLLLADYPASRYWYDRLKVYASGKDVTARRRRAAESDLLYLDVALNFRPDSSLSQLLVSAARALGSGSLDRDVFSFSVTSGLPSIMNGGRDFSEWSRHDWMLYKTLAKPVARVLGRDGVGLPLCAITESRFTRGEDVRASVLTLAATIPEICLHGTPDIEFAATSLIARVQLDSGSADDARQTLTVLRRGFVERGESFFLPNIDAALARIDLRRGDRTAWESWHRSKAPTDLLTPFVMDRYRYLTLAQVELALGDAERALLVLAPWRRILSETHRTIDSITLHVIEAIAQWRLRQEPDGPVDVGEWQDSLGQALDVAQSYSFVQPISTFGIAVLPLLQTVEWSKDPTFMRRLLAATRRTASFYPDFLREPMRLARPLTPTEERVLRLLASDMSNAKIGEVLGIRLPTVKSHVSHIMQKLGVTSRAKARTAAQQLGIL